MSSSKKGQSPIASGQLVGSMTSTPRTALDALVKQLASSHHPRFVPVEEIVDAVCHMHRLPISEVLGKGRTNVLTLCRHDLVIAIKTLRPFMDLVTIAKSAGYKGHAQAVVILQAHFQRAGSGQRATGSGVKPSASTPQPLAVASARREAPPPARGGLP